MDFRSDRINLFLRFTDYLDLLHVTGTKEDVFTRAVIDKPVTLGELLGASDCASIVIDLAFDITIAALVLSTMVEYPISLYS